MTDSILLKDLVFEIYDERPEHLKSQRRNEPHKGVRVTHIPTGLSASIGDERSQHRNREVALNVLKKKIIHHGEKDESI